MLKKARAEIEGKVEAYETNQIPVPIKLKREPPH